MTQVILDATTSAKLSSLQSPVVLCDETGRTLGYFQPTVPLSEMQRLIAQCPFSEDELSRRQQVRTGRPLADIVEDLKKR